MIFEADPDDPELLDRIALHLERGGILAHPTETVYGLGAAASPEGVEAVRAMKGREEEKPFLLLLPDAPSRATGHSGARWGLVWEPHALALADGCWPGPLTLILPDPNHRFPPGVRSATGGVAVRLSSHPFVRAVLGRWKKPIVSTSANRPGERPSMTPDEVLLAVQGRPGTHRFWFANAGDLPASKPSAVVDCTGSSPRLLREGAVPTEVLVRITPGLEHGPD